MCAVSRGSLPCTALTFVHNGGKQFADCLAATQFCKEHVVLDGNSTDGTPELAKAAGCTVFEQGQQYREPDGQIKDFGGITNQGIEAATQPWVLIVSADESLDEEFISNVRDIVQRGEPGVYHADRRYVVNGRVIEYASTYPNYQIRLFHKDCIEGFIKPVHERPKLKAGVEPKVLPGIQYVPMGDPSSQKPKHDRYIELELRRLGQISFRRWLSFGWEKGIRVVYRLLLILKLRLMHGWKDCYPLRYEWLDIRYPFLLWWRARSF